MKNPFREFHGTDFLVHYSTLTHTAALTPVEMFSTSQPLAAITPESITLQARCRPLVPGVLSHQAETPSLAITPLLIAYAVTSARKESSDRYDSASL